MPQSVPSHINEPTPESQVQPDVPIPKSTAPSSPNKNLEASTLEEILKNREVIYTNRESNTKIVTGWYDHEGTSELVAAKIMTMDNIE